MERQGEGAWKFLPVGIPGFLPWLPQERIKLLLWHSHNQHFSSYISNFGELLLYFILFLQ